MIFCHGCGKEIHESAVTCPHCGAPQQTQKQTSLKSQNIALVLAALLGAFGAHRFYLGKIVSGVFYFLFCWTGIPGLIAFIECFMIAFASQQNWAKKYNNGTLVPPVHIALKILMLIFPVILILGIVAAVAIPAYQDYNTRSRVAHGIEFLDDCKISTYVFYSEMGRLPTSLHETACLQAPLSGIKGVGIASGVNAVEIAVLFEGGKLDGKSVSLAAFDVSPGKEIEWQCVSATIPQKYLGPDCKERLDWVTSVHAAETEATQSTKSPTPAQQPQKEATVPAPASAPALEAPAPVANAETTTPSQPVAEPAPAAVPAPAATTAPEAAAGTSFSPSFDCAKVSSGSERMICSNKELAAADVKLMLVYRDAVSRATNKDGLKKMQNEWRKTGRDACSDADCMLKVYNERIVELSN